MGARHHGRFGRKVALNLVTGRVAILMMVSRWGEITPKPLRVAAVGGR
jgi:hypothetical protein